MYVRSQQPLDARGQPLEVGMKVRSVAKEPSRWIFGMTLGEIVNIGSDSHVDVYITAGNKHRDQTHRAYAKELEIINERTINVSDSLRSLIMSDI